MRNQNSQGRRVYRAVVGGLRGRICGLLCPWPQDGRQHLLGSFLKTRQYAPYSLVPMVQGALTRDCDSLDCGPIEASDIVTGQAGIGSTIIHSDVGDKELLCGWLGLPIDKPRIVCRRVRGRVAGEAEVCPWWVMGVWRGNGGVVRAIWSKENKATHDVIRGKGKSLVCVRATLSL